MACWPGCIETARGAMVIEKREHCGLRWEVQPWPEVRRPTLDGEKQASVAGTARGDLIFVRFEQ